MPHHDQTHEHSTDHTVDRTDDALTLERLGDRALVAHVLDVLADPPAEPADSFVLHAPLELLARARLLPLVTPAARQQARQRIVGIATEWAARQPHLGRPVAPPALPLAAAVAAGDLDEVDRAAVDLAARAPAALFTDLAAGTLLSHLGGAGHLPIFLDQVGRYPCPPRSALLASRALLRDLARHPDWTLRWIDEPAPTRHRRSRSFTDVLANPPSAGDPGTNFIYPTMHLVDASGLAADLLAAPAAEIPVDEAHRQLLRIAALSMLQDDPANAPYGWSHCLTMPQATLAVARRTTRPGRAVAIAATYVLGFRATQSDRAIDLDWRPPRPRPGTGLLDGDARDAVAWAWHSDEPEEVGRQLATFAATHHDAHLAKYTLACLRAARDDPGAASTYRAAAAHLAVWWRDSDSTAPEQDDHHAR